MKLHRGISFYHGREGRFASGMAAGSVPEAPLSVWPEPDFCAARRPAGEPCPAALSRAKARAAQGDACWRASGSAFPRESAQAGALCKRRLISEAVLGGNRYETWRRRTAECRKEHAVQCHHLRGRAGGQLPVLHHRAEHGRRCRAGRAAGRAGGDVPPGEVHAGDAGICGHRGPGQGREPRRGVGEQVPLAHPRGRCHRARGALLRG